jgi:hypothetical protein
MTRQYVCNNCGAETIEPSVTLTYASDLSLRIDDHLCEDCKKKLEEWLKQK